MNMQANEERYRSYILNGNKGNWWRKLVDEPWKRYALIGIALMGARQLDTVPDRYFAYGSYEIHKVDDLFGSTYHLYKITETPIPGTETTMQGTKTHWKWDDYKNHAVYYETEEVETEIGQSKVFNDLATMTGNWHVR